MSKPDDSNPAGAARATYRTDDGKNKLRPEVVASLDEWGWRENEWRERSYQEVNAFIRGWESAMEYSTQKSARAGLATRELEPQRNPALRCTDGG